MRPRNSHLHVWRLFVLVAGGATLAACASGRREDDRTVRPVAVSGVAAEPVTLETVNRRWQGNLCQIRVPLEIKKGTDRNGWSEGKWVKAPTLPGDHRVEIRVAVSNRDLLVREGYLYRKRSVRAGTMFIAQGWALLNPKRQKGLVLDLQVQGTPVQARIEFGKADKLEDLEDVERLARIELFQLMGPVEPHPNRTASLPASPPGRTAPAGTELVSPLPPAPQTNFRPAVEILATSAAPATVSRGSQVDLVVNYRVTGLPEGTVLDAVEERTLFRGEKAMGTFAEHVPRGNGTFTATQTINVAAELAPGLYNFRSRISLAGASSEGSALFEIR